MPVNCLKFSRHADNFCDFERVGKFVCAFRVREALQHIHWTQVQDELVATIGEEFVTFVAVGSAYDLGGMVFPREQSLGGQGDSQFYAIKSFGVKLQGFEPLFGPLLESLGIDQAFARFPASHHSINRHEFECPDVVEHTLNLCTGMRKLGVDSKDLCICFYF